MNWMEDNLWDGLFEGLRVITDGHQHLLMSTSLAADMDSVN